MSALIYRISSKKYFSYNYFQTSRSLYRLNWMDLHHSDMQHNLSSVQNPQVDYSLLSFTHHFTRCPLGLLASLCVHSLRSLPLVSASVHLPYRSCLQSPLVVLILKRISFIATNHTQQYIRGSIKSFFTTRCWFMQLNLFLVPTPCSCYSLW